MNFSFESLKPRSKTKHEDFYFDLNTPRGHFFAVIDFDPHDYANLNATLKGKLETIIGSFVSLSRFSADLFLGFLAKEINNFLFTLGAQSGGPDLPGSAALCLVNGNRISYYACGDVTIEVLNSGRLLPLHGPDKIDSPNEAASVNAPLAQLGQHHQETPLTEHVQAFTLQEDDVVLIHTKGLGEALADQGLKDTVAPLRTADAAAICAAIMKASADAADDRTLVVISGPYERYVDPVLSDLSKSVASLEEKLKALGEVSPRAATETADSEVQQRFSQQVEILKDDLRGKAAKIDLLELDEKLKNLSAVLAGKADTTDVLGLQSEVLKLGIVAEEAKTLRSQAVAATDTESKPAPLGTKAGTEEEAFDSRNEEVRDRGGRSLLWRVAAMALLIGIGGAVLGGWLQSRLNKPAPERWSVKTSGSQILISRLDAGAGPGVTMNVTEPLNTGEQTFSSFADVKQYIDTITSGATASQTKAQLTPTPSPTQATTEIAIKPGDSLRKLAQQYNVPQEKLMELNPTITRWPAIRTGQRIVVPSAAAVPSPSPQAVQQPTNSAVPNTIEVTVAPGDSINRFALRYGTTPDRIKELNPQITNWASIHVGQKVLLPAPPAG